MRRPGTCTLVPHCRTAQHSLVGRTPAHACQARLTAPCRKKGDCLSPTDHWRYCPMGTDFCASVDKTKRWRHASGVIRVRTHSDHGRVSFALRALLFRDVGFNVTSASFCLEFLATTTQSRQVVGTGDTLVKPPSTKQEPRPQMSRYPSAESVEPQSPGSLVSIFAPVKTDLEHQSGFSMCKSAVPGFDELLLTENLK